MERELDEVMKKFSVEFGVEFVYAVSTAYPPVEGDRGIFLIFSNLIDYRQVALMCHMASEQLLAEGSKAEIIDIDEGKDKDNVH